MSSNLFFIEPSDICLQNKGYLPDQCISDFLDEFEEMLHVLSNNKYRLLMDKFIGENLVDTAGEYLMPVNTSTLNDSKLKRRIIKLKETFYKIMSPIAVFIPTDPCSTDGDSLVVSPANNRELFEEKFYYEFFHSLMSCCYIIKYSDVDSILVIPSFTKLNGNPIELTCKCDKNSKNKTFDCISYTTLIDMKEKAKDELQALLSSINKVERDSVEVTQAPHAPRINNTIVQSYVDIPADYRTVLDILLFFGMNKLDIREWKSHRGVKGTICNCCFVGETTDGVGDIVEGWLIIKDMSCKVILYFPKKIGRLLISVVGEKFDYQNMVDLKKDIIF